MSTTAAPTPPWGNCMRSRTRTRLFRLTLAHRPLHRRVASRLVLYWRQFRQRRPDTPADGAVHLTFQQKVTRLRGRLRDPEWRQYGMVLLAGKALGIALLLSLVM